MFIFIFTFCPVTGWPYSALAQAGKCLWYVSETDVKFYHIYHSNSLTHVCVEEVILNICLLFFTCKRSLIDVLIIHFGDFNAE